MSGTVAWDPKTPSETVYRYADFTDELASGDHVATVSASASVYTGNDPSPAIVAGAIAVDNTAGVEAVAQVTLQAGVLGTIYQVLVTAVTALGLVLTKTAVLAVRPPVT